MVVAIVVVIADNIFMNENEEIISSVFDKTNAFNRLKKIKGQIEGIINLIEKGKCCTDVITQCRAVKGAISKVEEMVLEAHLKCCVVDAIKNNKEEKVIQEILDIYKLSSK